MIDGQFHIVFAGRLVPGRTEDEVKQNLARLFKTQMQQIERLFVGSEVTLKKNLNYAQAMKYQSALKQAGALVLIKKVEQESVSRDVVSQKQASQPKRVAEQSLSGLSNKDHQSPWSVAPPGERLPSLDTSNPTPLPDLSNYSVANPGEKLVEQQTQATAVEIDTSQLSLDELGPLPKSEQKPAPELDLSGLSIAPPGETIPNAPSDKPKLNPDTSHLCLE